MAPRAGRYGRRVLSLGANAYARRALRLQTRDATSGFRAWRAAALRRCDVLRTESNGYGFQVEKHLARRAPRSAGRGEHPITFTERVAGASKMTVDVAREAAVLVARWRWAELQAAQPATQTSSSSSTHSLNSGIRLDGVRVRRW
ncbi:hypothetical protein [Nocardioides kongjuensis]|uniref:hypothetical protein n=1 Tax=Nocardioides kongjuensis TaxID=349522 RepID=UPI0031E73F9F